MKFPKIWPCEYLGYLMTDWKELKKIMQLIYRVAQKLSHYQESALNRIKNRQ